MTEKEDKAEHEEANHVFPLQLKASWSKDNPQWGEESECSQKAIVRKSLDLASYEQYSSHLKSWFFNPVIAYDKNIPSSF